LGAEKMVDVSSVELPRSISVIAPWSEPSGFLSTVKTMRRPEPPFDPCAVAATGSVPCQVPVMVCAWRR
jgi:hypothetical protein